MSKVSENIYVSVDMRPNVTGRVRIRGTLMLEALALAPYGEPFIIDNAKQEVKHKLMSALYGDVLDDLKRVYADIENEARQGNGNSGHLVRLGQVIRTMTY